MSFSAIPNYRQAINEKGTMARVWYQFMTDIWHGKPSGDVSPLTTVSSPLRYQATTRGFMIVQGGTVSLIQFTRDGITNYNTGQTSGLFPLSQGDSLIVFYSSAPAFTWVPQ